MNRVRIPFVLFQAEGKTDIGYTDSQGLQRTYWDPLRIVRKEVP